MPQSDDHVACHAIASDAAGCSGQATDNGLPQSLTALTNSVAYQPCPSPAKSEQRRFRARWGKHRKTGHQQ